MINPKTGTTWAPDIRPEEIEEFDEEASDGAIAQYKAVDNHPILSGALDTLAFFRTHAAAVWYNKLAGRTVADEIEDLKAVADITQDDLMSFLVNLNIRSFNAFQAGHTVNFYIAFSPLEDLTNAKAICMFKAPYRIKNGSAVFSIRNNTTPYPEVATVWTTSNGTGTFYGNIAAKGTYYLQGSFVF